MMHMLGFSRIIFLYLHDVHDVSTVKHLFIPSFIYNNHFILVFGSGVSTRNIGSETGLRLGWDTTLSQAIHILLHT